MGQRFPTGSLDQLAATGGGPSEDGKWRDTRSELLEWSIVALPADPDALRKSHRRMMAAFVGVDAQAEEDPETGDQRKAALLKDSELDLPDLVAVADLVGEIRTALGP